MSYDDKLKEESQTKLQVQTTAQPQSQEQQAPVRNTAQLLAKRKAKPQEQHIARSQEQHIPEASIVEEVASDIVSDITNAVGNTSLEAPKAFLKKGLSKAKSFALRVVIHLSAFFCAGVMVDFVPSFTALGVYIGLVCLVARDTSMETDWLAPTGFGVAQMLVCLALGIPMTHALFWGGAQAWVQRLFMKRFSMGTEWVALILLLPLALQLSTTTLSILPLLGSFAALTAVGSAFWALRSKLQAKKLEQQSAANKKESRVENKEKAHLQEEVSAAKDDGPFTKYKESIVKLRTKQLLLPADMQESLRNLITSADAIVLCMQEDRRDKESGEKFLRRYLPATHSVLDKFCRLSGNAMGNSTASEDIAEPLRETGEMLQRLEQAFAHEHKSLLRNDIDDFSADLKVLDTLLKMEGR